MPTYYYTITNNLVENLIQANDLAGLDDYLAGKIHPEDEEVTSSRMVAPWVEYRDEDRLYHILSHATDVANNLVLEHFSKEIDFDISPDGNAYHLLDLAVENYVSDMDNPARLQTIKLLCKFQQENHGKITIGCALRKLICCIEEENTKDKAFEVSDMIIREYRGSIRDLYHYAIAWGHKKALDEIVKRYSDCIDFKWTYSAIEIAESFKHFNVADYAKRFLPC